MSTHSQFSPSGAHRWMACPGSIAAEAGLPDTSSEFADEGTAAHEVASWCLADNCAALAYLGVEIEVGERKFIVDADMCEAVQHYVDEVRAAAGGLPILAERRVDFSKVIGVEDQGGTADVIIVSEDGTEIQVRDLKFGRGVRVTAEDNPQLMLYALGALEEFDILGEVERVTVGIHQPRIADGTSEWTVSVEDLRAFGTAAANAAAAALAPDAPRVPGPKQCQWCKAKATCPELAEFVIKTVAGDFVDLTQEIAPQIEGAATLVPLVGGKHLASMLRAVDLVEDWCAAVRKHADAELLNGRPVPGFKLVQGKRGNRKWRDAVEAEEAMKAMRLKHDLMYDYSVISPTAAEKLFKTGAIGKRQWPKLQAHITQADGKPSVAPDTDPRPALVMTPPEADFDDLTAEPETQANPAESLESDLV